MFTTITIKNSPVSSRLLQTSAAVSKTGKQASQCRSGQSGHRTRIQQLIGDGTANGQLAQQEHHFQPGGGDKVKRSRVNKVLQS